MRGCFLAGQVTVAHLAHLLSTLSPSAALSITARCHSACAVCGGGPYRWYVTPWSYVRPGSAQWVASRNWRKLSMPGTSCRHAATSAEKPCRQAVQKLTGFPKAGRQAGGRAGRQAGRQGGGHGGRAWAVAAGAPNILEIIPLDRNSLLLECSKVCRCLGCEL